MAVAARTERGRARRRTAPRREGRWLARLPWAGPPLVVLLAFLPAFVPVPGIDGLVGVAVAVALAVAVYRRPVRGMVLVASLLPFQVAIVAALYELGLPAGSLRLFGYWKELVVVALAAAVLAALRRTPRRPDLVDALALGFVALGTTYLLLPQLVVLDPIGLERTTFDRLSAWRTDVLFVALFLVVRHLRPDEDEVRLVLRTMLRVGITLAALGAFEFLASDTWNTFAVDTLGIQQARTDVLQTTPLGSRPGDIRTYGTVAGAEIVRAGGPLFDYLGYAFVMAMTVALAAEHLVRGVWRRAALLTGLAGFALLVTQTRSAIVAGLAALALTLLPRRGVPVVVRSRFTVVAAALLVVSVPLALASGVTERFTSGDQGSDESHSASIEVGVAILGESPLGRGLATSAGTAQTRTLEGFAVIENQYLTTGAQLGVAGMALQAGFLLALAVRLHRLAGSATGTVGLVAGAARGALVAVLLIGWYLVPFVSLPLAWGLALLTGLAVGHADRERAADRRPERLAALRS